MKNIFLACLCFASFYCKAQVIAYPSTNDSMVELSSCADLFYVNPIVIGHQKNVTVSYYLTQSDAQNSNNPLSRFYTPVSDPQIIYARVDSNTTNDFSIAESKLDPKYWNGESPPPGISPCYFDVCDFDNNGVEVVNLDNLRCLYNGYGFPSSSFCSSNDNDVETTYYETQIDAENETNPISVNYSITTNKTVYRKIKNTTTGEFLIDDYLNLNFITSCSLDSDNDGIADLKEDVNHNLIKTDDDTDKDGLKNYQDEDDDNDGILTIDEDYNNNGDPTDDDTNNNGVPDYLEDSTVLSNTKNQISSFTIYPNPTNHKINVTTKNPLIDLELYNCHGKLLLKSNTKTLDLKNYPSGLYFLKITCNDYDSVTKKVIKQ